MNTCVFILKFIAWHTQQTNLFSQYFNDDDDPYRISDLELTIFLRNFPLLFGVIYHFTLNGKAQQFDALYVYSFHFLLFECLTIWKDSRRYSLSTFKTMDRRLKCSLRTTKFVSGNTETSLDFRTPYSLFCFLLLSYNNLWHST